MLDSQSSSVQQLFLFVNTKNFCIEVEQLYCWKVLEIYPIITFFWNIKTKDLFPITINMVFEFIH